MSGTAAARRRPLGGGAHGASAKPLLEAQQCTRLHQTGQVRENRGSRQCPENLHCAAMHVVAAALCTRFAASSASDRAMFVQLASRSARSPSRRRRRRARQRRLRRRGRAAAGHAAAAGRRQALAEPRQVCRINGRQDRRILRGRVVPGPPAGILGQRRRQRGQARRRAVALQHLGGAGARRGAWLQADRQREGQGCSHQHPTTTKHCRLLTLLALSFPPAVALPPAPSARGNIGGRAPRLRPPRRRRPSAPAPQRRRPRCRRGPASAARTARTWQD